MRSSPDGPFQKPHSDAQRDTMQSIRADARVPVARKAVSHDAVAPPSADRASQVQLVSVSFPILHGASAVQSIHGAKHMVTLLQARQAAVLLAQVAGGGAVFLWGGGAAFAKFGNKFGAPALAAHPPGGHATQAPPRP